MPSAHQGEVKYMFQHQADAELIQAAPVQNTWYTVLDTTEDVRIIIIEEDIAVAVETLECRVTIDGNVLGGGKAGCVVGTPYYIRFSGSLADTLGFEATTPTTYGSYLMEGQSVKVEARKTTALGAGNLHCLVKWARLLPT